MTKSPPVTPALRVCSFESRRSSEMEALLRRFGAEPTVAPSMRELPLDENPAAFACARRLLAGEIDIVIFMTGVGAQALLDAMSLRHSREELLASLNRCCIVVRGPKPVAVLREWGTHIDHRAPEPNTWREVIAVLESGQVELPGKTVAVQEYGIANPEFYEALQTRGADVVPVPVYRWDLPDDVGPLEDAVRGAVNGGFDVIMFTSAFQLQCVQTIADRLQLLDAWREAARQCVIASIGPTASEALRAAGLAPDLEPSHPKMGHLVRETCAEAFDLLHRKQCH